MKLFPTCRLLALGACVITLRADVQYDVITTFSNFTATGTRIKAVSGLLDMTSDQYTPKTAPQQTSVAHYEVKGDKLAASDSKTRTIYDLNAKTVTSLDLTNKTYYVESFGERYAREEKKEKTVRGTGGDKDNKVDVVETHETAQIDRQTASRFDLISVAHAKNLLAFNHGKPWVDGSMVCWMAERSLSTDLDAFRKKWAAATPLEFPYFKEQSFLETFQTFDFSGSLRALLAARGQLAGHMVSCVFENRPPGGVIPYNPADFDTNDHSQKATFAIERAIAGAKVNLIGNSVSHVSTDSASDSEFMVPSGFEKKKPPK